MKTLRRPTASHPDVLSALEPARVRVRALWGTDPGLCAYRVDLHAELAALDDEVERLLLLASCAEPPEDHALRVAAISDRLHQLELRWRGGRAISPAAAAA